MTTKITVNPAACDGFGFCVEMLPEVLGVDEWGFPITGSGVVPAELVAAARRAVQFCPCRALRLEAIPSDTRG